ncbi:MAG: hypothetical protein JNK79_18440 [Chitinophagaceae bacterium]|nr:hypothetical protein [Chitinophagaceae bacterium]
MKLLIPILSCVVLFFSAEAFSQTRITLSALRSGTVSTTTTYFVTDAGKEGIFVYDAKDATSPNNGGTVIVNGTRRFKRVYSGPLDVRWFGMKGDYNGTSGTENSAAFKAAIDAAKKDEVLLVPAGQYYVNSSIAMPVGPTRKVNFLIYGDIYFGKGFGFIIEGRNQEFKSYGSIIGKNSGATTEAGFAAYTGTGVYLKNAYNCEVHVNEVKNFKYGIEQSGDKSGGAADGSQYNKIYFRNVHSNYVQLRISIKGTTSSSGNWNNRSFWYGGRLGTGIPGSTYGKGGWYGVMFIKESSSTSTSKMNGHVFHDIAFEGLEVGIKASTAEHNSFIGGGFEPKGVRKGIDLDPVTCVGNKFIGITMFEEQMFVPGRLGSNTVIEGTPFWTGPTPNIVVAGNSAMQSITPNKFLITTNKYTPTSFLVNKAHDLISQTGEFPTVQAMMYRINGVIRSVPYKNTFLNVTTSTTASTITLPPNIGILRVETNQAKVFKINVGDIVKDGENFIVEYLSPAYPISFVRADNSSTLLAASNFPSGGTYRCLWVNGQYKVSKIGAEFKTFTQTGPTYSIAAGIETHYVNNPYNNSSCTLPSAKSWPGRVIVIKNKMTKYTCQVIGVSASDESMIPPRGAMTVKSDGTTWNIISFYKKGVAL